MSKSTRTIELDVYACGLESCETEHEVRSGEPPKGYLVVVSPVILGEHAEIYGEDERTVYACSQGHIGRAVVARVNALQASAEHASDVASGRAGRTDDELAAEEDGYDGPMPDDLTEDNDGHEDDVTSDPLVPANAGSSS